MTLFIFVVFHLGVDGCRVRLLLIRINGILEFRKTTRNGLAHLQSLAACISEDHDPPVFTQLPPQRLSIRF